MILAALLMLVAGTALLTWASAIADYLAQVYRPYADRWSYARIYADANKNTARLPVARGGLPRGRRHRADGELLVALTFHCFEPPVVNRS